MDPHFGRAGGFLLVEEGAEPKFIDNTARAVSHGAGTSAAATMSEYGVQAVISGEFGPKAYQALEKLGIEMWLAPSGLSAWDALERFGKGELKRKEIKVFR